MGMSLKIEKAHRFFIQRSGPLFILITHGSHILSDKIFLYC
jgi:hypothetical protein